MPSPTHPLQPPDLPMSFREEIVPRVFADVRGGASVALVGLAGVGMSNVLRFMTDPRIASHHLGPDASNCLPALIEADRWHSPGAVFVETARAVVTAAQSHHWPRAEQAALRHRFEAAATLPLPQSATPLAEVLAHVCDGLERRVMLVCDEFDPALAQLPTAILRELRALRDSHKFRLSYVVGLHSEPTRRRATRPSGSAKFIELFETHTYPLRPYSRADAQVASARKTTGWTPGLNSDEAEALYRVTGGHAKLLIAALAVLENRRHLPWANVERALWADPAVEEACRELWLDLAPTEQSAVWLLARERADQLTDSSLTHLRLRGLAVGGPPFVFSSLLEHYVVGQPEPTPAREPAPPSRLRDPRATSHW